jgi:hypothetical protein
VIVVPCNKTEEESDDADGLFLAFEDGTLWSYDSSDDLRLPAGEALGGIRAYSWTGRRMTLVRSPDSDMIAVELEAPDQVANDSELRALLVQRLRERNVADVDAMSFPELVYKASIRFPAPRPDGSRANVIATLIEAVTTFLGRRP